MPKHKTVAYLKIMEENKNCCEKTPCEKMNNCCPLAKCCTGTKCNIFKYLLFILVLFVIFCLGSQYGEFKSEIRKSRYNGGMMNWDYKVIKPIINTEIPNTENSNLELE